MSAQSPARLPLLDPMRDPELCALLRAAGMPDACLPHEADPHTPPLASDFDCFLALATALPACAGHPRAETIHASLASATGVARPLCPHTAKDHWQGYVRLHWYGESLPEDEMRVTDTLSPCPLCAPAEPIRLSARDVCRLPDEITVLPTAQDLPTWTAALAESVPPVGKFCLLTVPEGYTFVRPDLYHVGMALSRRPETRNAEEKALLFGQAARVLGELLAARGDTLLLRATAPAAASILPLLTYLRDIGRLPDTVYLSEDPADAAFLSGRMSRVRTGLCFFVYATAASIQAAITCYARLAPIGRAFLLEE